MLELYHDWASFCSIKVRLCLAEKNLPWESRFVDLMRLDQLKPDYLRLNPNAVVPTLVHDGRAIWESSFINEYLDETFPEVPLVPKDAHARARMRYWVKFEDDVLHPVIRPASFNLMIRKAIAALPKEHVEARLANHPNPSRAADFKAAAGKPADTRAVEEATVRIKAAIDRMDQWLAQNKWLAGEGYSLADVAAAPFIDRLEELNFVGFWEGRPALQDWIARIKARPAYQKAIPETKQRLPKPDWNWGVHSQMHRVRSQG
ncbi:MAG: glutathione S-transferase family protein [Xanthobacteraceae bacterium]|nr:glutathione S-transferase family protein [Xanthobacteraceae bacterium]